MVDVFRAWARVPVEPPVNDPPTPPLNLGASVSSKRVILTFDAATDDVEVVVYIIYRDGEPIWYGMPGTVYGVYVYVDTVTVEEETDFNYVVTALDESLQESDPSNLVTVTVFPDEEENVAPTIPDNVSATYNSAIDTMTVTWDASTDDNGVAGYGVYIDGVGKAIVTTGTTWSGVVTATSIGTALKEVTVTAVDAAGLASAPSDPDSVTVDVLVPPNTAPTVPTGLAVSYDGTQVPVTWIPSTDDDAVAGYVVTRDDKAIWFGMPPTFFGALLYVDRTALPGSHNYQVEAYDEPNLHSAKTSKVFVTVPGGLVPPPSISRAGLVDVSDALQAWFDTQVPNGATQLRPTVVDFPSTAAYRVDKGLNLDRRKRITLNGNGSLMKAVDPLSGSNPNQRGRSNVYLRQAEDMRFVGVKLQGARSPSAAYNAYDGAREAQHGFWLRDGIRLSFIDCTVTDTFGDWLATEWYDRNLAIRGPRDVFVERFVGRRAGRQGFGLTCVAGITIQNSNLQRVARAYFDMEPGNGAIDWVQDVIIQDNYTTIHGLNWASNWGAGRTNDILIQRNRCIGGPMQMELGTDSRRRMRFSILNNFSDYPYGTTMGGLPSFAGAIIRAKNYDHLTVTGNDWRLSPTLVMYAVSCAECTDVTVNNPAMAGRYLTGHANWPGGDGQARYYDYELVPDTRPGHEGDFVEDRTVVGTSPSYSV